MRPFRISTSRRTPGATRWTGTPIQPAYNILVGANDVHDLVPKSGAWASLATAQKTLQSAADKYAHEIMQTIEVGVREILVIGVPDIGIQPYYNGLADEAARRAVGTQYSQMLDQMVRTALDD